MTNKILVGIVIAFMSLVIVSALDMNAGETKYIDLSGEADYVHSITYEVTSNSSNLDGLHIEINGNITTIWTDYWYKPDSFTITFLINGENYVSNPTSGGGNSNLCYTNYNCSVWSLCDGYFQNRTCTAFLNCSAEKSQEKPSELNVCYEQITTNQTEDPQENKTTDIPEEPEETKDVKWFLKIPLIVVCGILVLIIIFLITYYISKGRERE